MAVSLDYEPTLGGEPFDPVPDGGGVDLLRLYTDEARSTVPVLEAGPAVRVTAAGDPHPRFRFTFAQPADGTYYATIEWREATGATPYVDADEIILFPLAAARPPHLLITGADLAKVVGNRVPRASLDEAAAIVSGLVEGYTRGRSVYPDTVPRDLAAVARAAALRLAPNLHQQQSVSTGEQSITGAFRGFTVHEQVVLNRYRRRSA